MVDIHERMELTKGISCDRCHLHNPKERLASIDSSDRVIVHVPIFFEKDAKLWFQIPRLITSYYVCRGVAMTNFVGGGRSGLLWCGL